ncbi:MAG: hypothetical protein NTX57_04995 [Armatimonadetes bacterium]|nr:hypothetical protein [Armatimonadota bacterium]
MHVRRLSVILGAACVPFLVSLAVQAQAPVKIKFHCKVPGYSSGSGWVRIENGGPGGGRVVRNGNDMVTDRVARTEKFRVSIDDPSFTKKCKCQFTLEARVSSKNRKVFQGELTIPFQREFDIPDDPNFDNVLVEVFDPIAPNGVVARRVPIGTRPK